MEFRFTERELDVFFDRESQIAGVDRDYYVDTLLFILQREDNPQPELASRETAMSWFTSAEGTSRLVWIVFALNMTSVRHELAEAAIRRQDLAKEDLEQMEAVSQAELHISHLQMREQRLVISRLLSIARKSNVEMLRHISLAIAAEFPSIQYPDDRQREVYERFRLLLARDTLSVQGMLEILGYRNLLVRHMVGRRWHYRARTTGTDLMQFLIHPFWAAERAVFRGQASPTPASEGRDETQEGRRDYTAEQLLQMPIEERHIILAAQAEAARAMYEADLALPEFDRELTAFTSMNRDPVLDPEDYALPAEPIGGATRNAD